MLMNRFKTGRSRNSVTVSEFLCNKRFSFNRSFVTLATSDHRQLTLRHSLIKSICLHNADTTMLCAWFPALFWFKTRYSLTIYSIPGRKTFSGKYNTQ